LIIQGARQVGKTYTVKEFGEKYYDGNVVYFFFKNNKVLNNIFENFTEPKVLIEKLSKIIGKTIEKNKTLIIFDEIQACLNAVSSLKLFNEIENDYHIICTGSLLGFSVKKQRF
jgi:predicted AAA+ superfamily ATPase